ncbi:MAG: hypothetical protein E5X37_30205 [Mesorhizobium sp.]|nr:MAG: hypothetical protein E5X37_30205 [Mesorhizobium sp.]
MSDGVTCDRYTLTSSESRKSGDTQFLIRRSPKAGGANWQHVVASFCLPESARRLRRAVRIRGHFSNDAAMMLLYLVLNHVAEEC